MTRAQGDEPNEAGFAAAASVDSWLARLRRDLTPAGTPADVASDDSPFMSFLIPTAPGGSASLDETLLSLAAQTDTDFEAIVLADLPADDLEAVRRSLAEHPATLRDRVRLVPAMGTPAEVLDAGLGAARGSYVSLSHDVTWLGHWVEVARAKAGELPGRCVRGLVLEQEVATVHVGGVTGLRATGRPVPAGGPSFSVAEHVAAPRASTYAHAFPRSLSSDLGLGFDTSHGTAAVRRHLLRAVELAGVVEVGDIVAIHQVQEPAGPREADDDLTAMVEDLTAQPYLLPAGWVTEAIGGNSTVSAALDAARAEVDRLEHLTSLKDDHITNLERILGERDERLTRVQDKLAKRDEQVERLRAKVAQHTGKTEQPPAEQDSGGRGRWFKGRS